MKIKWLIFFLILFGIAGYFREFFFVHTNRIMYEKYYHTNVYEYEPMPSVMKPFASWSYEQLYYSKYPFTLFFTLIFYLLSRSALKKMKVAPVILRILNYSYLIILALAAVSMIYGFFVKERLQSDEYTLSRWLLGIAQSPIICLILLASEKLYLKSFQSDKTYDT